MRLRTLSPALALALLAGARLAGAQSLATRVDRASDGMVRMEVPSRAGVCGDGRDVVGYRSAIFARNFQSIGGSWSGVRCVPGPLRVTVVRADGEVVQVRVQVSGEWPATDARVTDLGQVDPGEASAYFFALAPRLERSSGRDRVLLPAVLADADVVHPLVALARDETRAQHLRGQAVQWLGVLGDDEARRALHGFIDDPRTEHDVRKSAIFALANGGDVPASEFTYLRRLYQSVDRDDLREAVIQGVSRDASPAGNWVMTLALDAREPMRLRKSALFWAGQREATPVADLVRAFREAPETVLREHAIFVLSQRREEAAIDALIRIAREERDTAMRGKALFWLAQKDDPRVKKLIADIVLK
jgi:hypothetical protein